MSDAYYCPPEDRSPCPDCGGSRVITTMEHAPNCRVDEDRECAALCPVEVERPCENCGPTLNQFIDSLSKSREALRAQLAEPEPEVAF